MFLFVTFFTILGFFEFFFQIIYFETSYHVLYDVDKSIVATPMMSSIELLQEKLHNVQSCRLQHDATNHADLGGRTTMFCGPMAGTKGFFFIRPIATTYLTPFLQIKTICPSSA